MLALLFIIVFYWIILIARFKEQKNADRIMVVEILRSSPVGRFGISHNIQVSLLTILELFPPLQICFPTS